MGNITDEDFMIHLCNKQFKGKCRACGIEGHKEAECWTEPKNQSKAIEGYLEKLKAKEASAEKIEMVLALI